MWAVEAPWLEVGVTGRLLVRPEAVGPSGTLAGLVVLPQVTDESIIHVDYGEPSVQFTDDDVGPL